jgi:hypothetical protein
MAARSATEAIARKFLALAQDYEEHAKRAEKGMVIIDLTGPEKETRTVPPRPVLSPASPLPVSGQRKLDRRRT